MSSGAWMCGVLVLPFAIVGLLFVIFKEKATKFVAGLMLLGTILSYAITTYMAIPTFIIWFILFFKGSHIDVHKAFDKYLLK